MDSEFLRISLIVYAISASLFFITFEVVMVLLSLRLLAILRKIEQLADTAGRIETLIKDKIDSANLLNFLVRFIEKYRRKE